MIRRRHLVVWFECFDPRRVMQSHNFGSMEDVLAQMRKAAITIHTGKAVGGSTHGRTADNPYWVRTPVDYRVE